MRPATKRIADFVRQNRKRACFGPIRSWKNTTRSFNVDPHALLVDCDIAAREIFRETAYRCLVEIGAAPTEEDLRAKVVVPILQALGYRNYDIHLEEYLPHSGRADAVAYINDVPVIAVECKRPGALAKGHAVRDALTQAERYAIDLQVGRTLITDGDVWLLTDGRSEVLQARLSLNRLIGDHPSHFVLPGRPDTRTRLACLAERTIRRCSA